MKQIKKTYKRVLNKAPLMLLLLSIILGCSKDGNDPQPDPDQNGENLITSFVFKQGDNNRLSGDITAVINQENSTIEASFPFGTDVGGLIPTITISNQAIVSPESRIKIDLTSPKTYTVTAEDESTKTYTVKATIEKPLPSGKNLITGFVFEKANNPKLSKDISAIIDQDKLTIEVSFLTGTVVNNLKPTLTISNQATVSPESSVEIDLTSPVTYTVTAEDNSTRAYTVKAIIEGPKSDRDILEIFYAANPDNTLGWDLSATDMSAWNGVSIAGDRVIALDVYDKKLTTIPAVFGGLTKLEALYIYSNEISNLPTEFGALSNLKTLNLSNNKLASYPAALESLGELQQLNISSNEISTLPGSIKSLSDQLVTLRLDGNKLTSLPKEIGDLTGLIDLSAQSNALSGLPAEIGNLNALRNLRLKDNVLIQLPPEIGNLSNLEILSLESNEITDLPDEIGDLSHLNRLLLDNNDITLLPRTIEDLDNLMYLSLENNKLSTIHSNIGSLSSVIFINLNKNQIEILPRVFGNLKKLDYLTLEHNKLTTIPKELSRMTSITSLILNNNELTSIPVEIGSLTKLVELDLTDNQLTSIPQKVCDLEDTGTQISKDTGVSCM